VGVAELEYSDLGAEGSLEFDNVINAMMSRETGDIVVRGQTNSLQYFFTDIPGTNYGVAIRIIISSADNRYRRYENIINYVIMKVTFLVFRGEH